MAWSLEDLAGWLEDTVDTFRGKNRNKPGGEAIYQGAIQPLKTAADVTGVSQGVRGVSPGASPMEKAMGLIAMLSAGTAGAGADDIARVGGQVAQKGGDKFLDVFGPKATMYHAGPTSGIKKLVPNVARDAGSPNPYIYLSPEDRVLGNIPQYLAPGHRMPANQQLTGSVYRTRVPQHRLEDYTIGPSGLKHWAKRTAVPVKVKDEISFANQNVSQINKALEDWLKKRK